ncbi:MAG: DNA-protecting protein DprA [Bacteroidetes bacterium]|nr:DNA-protecting protein DprA [Bacteroidota bacterium]
MEKLKYIYFLTKVKSLGNNRIRKILKAVPNDEDFFNCSRNDLKRIAGIDSGISAEIIAEFSSRYNHYSDFEREYEISFKKGVRIISVLDDEYPENLKSIYDAPALLFIKGKTHVSDRYSISVVGTRNPTEYGKYTCEIFTRQLSELGIPVISGFARGIDSIVHRECLRSGNITYAVLGNGIDVIYPPENLKLYDQMCEKGTFISEFPSGTIPDKVNFPRRNRIISGISLGSVVIESGLKGGSMLTADLANDQNREVFAVPGYINSKQSDGTNELIKKGQAKLVTCIDDILVELEYKMKKFLEPSGYALEKNTEIRLEGKEKILFDLIGYEMKNIDKLNEESGCPVSDCLVNLLSLEFKGLIRQLPGKNFIKI